MTEGRYGEECRRKRRESGCKCSANYKNEVVGNDVLEGEEVREWWSSSEGRVW